LLKILYNILKIYKSNKFKCLHGKNSFVEVSKNLARYRSENNFVELSKLCRTLKH